MSNPFSQTLRSIQADGVRRAGLAVGVGAGVLLAWSIWFLAADLTIYASSVQGRLEVVGRPSPLLAENAGRVSRVAVSLGQTVAEGDVILELNTEAIELDLDEARARESAASVRLDTLQRELESQQAAAASDRAAIAAEIRQAEASAAAARARAGAATAEADRAKKLFEAGHLSAAERDSLVAAGEAGAAEARELDSAATRTREEGERRRSERDAALADLQGQIDALQGDLEGAWARVSRLELDIERAEIRAPVSGRLAELVPLAVGTWVESGATLGEVVPEGDVQIVADFAPAEALGRIVPGQRARMRLDGFPWTRFGALPATVARVSDEPREGLIRVELTPQPQDDSAVPLRHALTGSVEVAVEHLSPAELVLRAAGRATTGRSDGARP